ncbi:protein lifeguard 1 [Drosophila montana]|uniref:protein lifeguard 1 n=1 Tax=Drosophila montana TaxID=40370 RepID=UPI00313E221C
MQLNIGFCFLSLAFLLAAQAKPTFDKMAEVLLGVLDDSPHYARGGPYGPLPPSAPLIHEGYDHGYDYYYGGGGGHVHGNGVVVGSPYSQAPPQPAYGYYPRPVHGPAKGYYPEPQYPHGYAPTAPTYGQGYGRSGPIGPGVGGYKQHGY